MEYKDRKKIIQIIPADGWYVSFETNTDELCYDKIVCFALVEENGRRFVLPMSGEEGIDFCENASNYHSIVYSPEKNLERVEIIS